eukprot:6972632-Prymnesium_polylepis.1
MEGDDAVSPTYAMPVQLLSRSQSTIPHVVGRSHHPTPCSILLCRPRSWTARFACPPQDATQRADHDHHPGVAIGLRPAECYVNAASAGGCATHPGCLESSD